MGTIQPPSVSNRIAATPPGKVDLEAVRGAERVEVSYVMARLNKCERPSLLAIVHSSIALAPDPTTPRGFGTLYLALSRQGFCAYKPKNPANPSEPARCYKLTEADLAKLTPGEFSGYVGALRAALANRSLDKQMEWVTFPVIDRVTKHS